jgi:uncharacterized protein (DUF3820 family)
MRQPFRTACVVFFLVWAFLADTQAQAVTLGPKVTVETMRGEVFEGTLSALSELYLEIEIDGRLRRLYVPYLRYISFEGRVGAPTPSPTPPSGSIADAIEAASLIHTMRVAAVADARPCPYCFVDENKRSRAIREECESDYYARLDAITALVWPRVKAFLDQPADEWADMKVWIKAAANVDAPVVYARYLDLAKKLSTDAGERLHRESPTVRDLVPGIELDGRLGFGDTRLAPNVDKEHSGDWADQYHVALDSATRVHFITDCVPSYCTAVLLDAQGKPLGKKDGRLVLDLPAGNYFLWVVNKEPSVYTLEEISDGGRRVAR